VDFNYRKPVLEEKINNAINEILMDVVRKGKSHGTGDIDIITSLSYEQSLRNSFQDFISDWSGEAKSELAKFKAKDINNIKKEIETYNKEIKSSPDKINEKINTCNNKFEKILIAKENEKHAIPNRIVIRENFDLIETNYEDSKRKFDDISKRLKRKFSDSTFDVRWANSIIAILAILEIPFSFSAFLILKTTPIISLSISILFAIALAFSAHFVGKSFKQRRGKTVGHNLFVFFLLIISVLSLQVTSHFRTLHAEGKGIDMERFFVVDDLLFLIIGGIIYMISASLSYFSHDSDEDFVKAFDEMKKCEALKAKKERDIEKIKKNEYDIIAKEIEKIKSEQNFEIEKIKNEYKNLTDNYNEAISFYNKALEYYVAFEQRINENYKKSLNIFREANQRSRSDERGKEFNNHPILDLNLQLQNYKPYNLVEL
jgi:hypothetical protein